MIAAILRAQILSMTRLGRASLLGGMMTALWYAMWTGGAVALWFTFRSLKAEQLTMWAPLALAAVFGYWQLAPLVTASTGAALDMRKLLAYPVPRRKLFLVEVLLRLTTGIEMLLVLTGTSLGMSGNPISGPRALPRVIAIALAFTAFNVLLASGTRSLLERWLTRRHVREFLAVILAMVWVLPRFLGSIGVGSEAFKGPGAALQFGLFPWASAARADLGISMGTSVLSLGVWVALAWWFGMTQFARNLRYDSAAAQATPLRPSASGKDHWTERFYRWPALLWRDPLAAIVEKELRSLARNPRFRMSFLMGCTFSLLMWFPILLRRHGQPTSSTAFPVVVFVYSLTMMGQASFWNCFGFDRSASAFYFAAPPPLERCLVGKNIAVAAFILLQTVVLAGAMLALGMAHGWIMLVESVAATGVAAVYMLAAGNVNSVRYPRAAAAEKVMQGNTGGRSPGVVFLFYLLALIPIALAYLARFAFDSDVAFLVVLAAAAVGGAVLYRTALKSSTDYAIAKRERLLAELSKGEGPVITG